MPPVDTNYYSECGRDAPSTVESLGYNNDKVHEWIKKVQMPTIDEDGDSVISEDLSNEKMLNCLYGNRMNENEESLPDSGESSNVKIKSRDQVDPQPSTALCHSFDDNGASNRCNTPTTGVYQSYIDNTNNLQPLPFDSDVSQPVVPVNNASDSVGNTTDTCDPFPYIHLLEDDTNLTSVPLSEASVARPPVSDVTPATNLTSVPSSEASVALPPVSDVTPAAVHHPILDTTQGINGDYVHHDIALSDVNTSPFADNNTDVPASHSTEFLGQYVSHSAVQDVCSTNGLPSPSQNNPSHQENTSTQALNYSLSTPKPNSVSSASSAPYVTLDDDNESFVSPLDNNTQASGEYVPYNTAINCDEMNDCGLTNGYLPYSASGKVVLTTSDALTKENNLQFLSNGYVTTSV